MICKVLFHNIYPILQSDKTVISGRLNLVVFVFHTVFVKVTMPSGSVIIKITIAVMKLIANADMFNTRRLLNEDVDDCVSSFTARYIMTTVIVTTIVYVW